MFVTSAIGAGITSASLAALFFKLRKGNRESFQDILEASFITHGLHTDDRAIAITKWKKEKFGYKVQINLPSGITVDKFRKAIPAIEQDTWSRIMFRHIFGRDCEITIGKKNLEERIDFDEKMWTEGIKVPFMSHFGIKYLDFYDEASWHLLAGGAARTGKTAFLRLVMSTILTGTDGKAKVVISTVKDSDFYMFRGIPTVDITDSVEETIQLLSDVLEEAKERKSMLKAKGDVFDLKHFREKYPNEEVQPIFIIIDEFARFSEEETIQEMLQELIETYSYVDVHLVLATQRPDATTVMKPRIRANILARVGLTTADEANSKLIVGTPDCAHLGGIRGRCVLLDGSPVIAQVPYINPKQCEEVGRRYREDAINPPRQIDNRLTEAVQSLQSQSISLSDL